MPTNYLNNLNNVIKTNSSTITNADNRDSLSLFSRRVTSDLNSIKDYINNVVYTSYGSLCSKPLYPYDVLESGLSGNTIVTYPEDLGNTKYNSELFWIKPIDGTDGRPATIKESFDYILSNMSEKLVEISNATVDLSDLWDQIRCNSNNLDKVRADSFGKQYNFNCTSTPFLQWPLAKHIYELFNQLVDGHNITDLDSLNNGADYPVLSINALIQPANLNQAGIAEIAEYLETALVTETSPIGNQLVISPKSLYQALSINAISNDPAQRFQNLLRERVKEVALEKIQEASINDLDDVDTTVVVNDHVLAWSSADQKWKPREFDNSLVSNLGTNSNPSNISDLIYPDNEIPYYHAEYNNVISNTLVWSKFLNTWTKKTPEMVNSLTTTFKNLSGYRIDVKNSIGSRVNNIPVFYKNIPFVFKAAPYKQLITNSSPDVINYISRGKYQNNSNAFIFNENIGVIDNRNKYLSQNTCSRFDISQNEEHGEVVVSLLPLVKEFSFAFNYTYKYFSKEKILGLCRSDLDYNEPLTSFSVNSKQPYLNFLVNLGILVGNSDYTEINALILRNANNQDVDVALKQLFDLYLDSYNDDVFSTLTNEQKNDFVKTFFLNLIKEETSKVTTAFNFFLREQKSVIDLDTNVELSNIASLQNSSSIPGLSKHNVSLQDKGFSKIMVLGPYSMGDELYICPGSILDTRGIEGGVGICISETFLNYTLYEIFTQYYFANQNQLSIVDSQTLVEYLFPLPSAANINLASVVTLFESTTLKDLFFSHDDLGLDNALVELKFLESVGTIVNSFNSMDYDLSVGVNSFCENLLEIDGSSATTKYSTANHVNNASLVEDYTDFLYFSLKYKDIDTLIETWLESNDTIQNRLLFTTYYTRRNEALKLLRSLSLVDAKIKL